MNSVRKSIQLTPRFSSIIRTMGDKKPTSDSAGSIKAAGGAFAKMEVAHEEEYFYKLRQEQLNQLKAKKVDEVKFREDAIKSHEDAIKRHKDAIDGLKTK